MVDFGKIALEHKQVLDQYKINTPQRKRHFFAQLAHESGGFEHMKEQRSDASAEQKYGVGTRVGKILGNTQPGDGAKYKGRGYIQLTGRWNYTHFAKLSGLDIVNNPELLEDPKNAMLVSALYWDRKGLNKQADRNDIKKLTKKINGGMNGFKDRVNWFNKIGAEGFDRLESAVRAPSGTIAPQSTEDKLFARSVVGRSKPEEAPGIGESIAAGFRRESPIAQVANQIPFFGADRTVEPGYNPFDEDVKGYENFAEQFRDSPNPEWTKLLKEKIDNDVQDAKIQSEGGGAAFFGSIAGGIFSPTTLLPGIGLASKGVLGAKLGARVAAGSLMAGTAIGADELALHELDSTRTKEESFANIAGGLALGGLLGGVIGRKSYAPLVEAIDKKAAAAELTGGGPRVVVDSSAGAMQTPKLSLKQEGIAITNSAFKGALKTMKETNPILRGLTNETVAARRVTSRLLNHDYTLGKNVEGFYNDIPVEARMNLWDGKANGVLSRIDDIGIEAKKTSGMAIKQFRKELVDSLQKNVEPSDARLKPAFKEMKKFIGEMAHDLKANKLLGDDFDVNGFLPKIVDSDKVYLKRNALIKKISEAVKRTDSSIDNAGALSKAEDAIDGILRKKNPDVNKLITDLKISEDTFDGFYTDSLDRYLFGFSRKAAEDISFKEVGFSNKNLTDEIADIRKEFSDLIEAAPTAKAKQKLAARMEKTVKDTESARDLLLRRFGRPDDPYSFGSVASRAVLSTTFLARLGGVALSQIPDLARLSFIKSFSETIGGDIHKLGNIIKTAKLSKTDSKFLGIGLDTSMSSRALEIGNIDDAFRTATKVDRFFNKATAGFGNLSLMNPMNDFTRRYAAELTAHNMLKDLQLWKLGKLSAKKITEFNRLGFKEADIARVVAQLDKHGEVVDGIRMANLHKWDRSADVFKQALRREVDRVIVMPQIGDKALWMSRPAGRVIGQFKSFGQAMMNKVILPGIQRPDAVFFIRTGMQVALGSAAYVLKAQVAGRVLKKDDTKPLKLIMEGVDRSGVTGYLYDVHNMFERMTGYGINKALKTGPSSRYRHRGKLSAIFGPGVGMAEDVISSLPGLFSGRPTKGEIKKIIRATPGTQLFYFKALSNKIAEKIHKELR